MKEKDGEEYAIEVQDVYKTFNVYLDKANSLKEKMLFWKRNKKEVREVLKGINLNIKKGEAVALIGVNGSGKSTLLKLMTKIIYPNKGQIITNGKLTSLLELGAGFHPDFSGRENIYFNASIFGLTKKQIDDRLQQIIDFSELKDYIDNPVRTYSSGMYMRLAFAVAINVDADILLIDEILAVGDVNFQTKCINKLFELKNQGITIVLVSHSMDQVEKVCTRSIWLQDGKIKMDDTPQIVKQAYLNYMDGERKKAADHKLQVKNETVKEKTKDNEAKDVKIEKKVERRGTGEARINKVLCLNEAGQETYFFDIEETISFKLLYNVDKKMENVNFGLCIYRNDGVRCYGVNTITDDISKKVLDSDSTVELEFEKIKLLPGTYTADVTIEKQNGETVDYYDKAVKFEIGGNRKCSGVAWLDHKWKL